MFDDPKPEDTVQGKDGSTCTVAEFNAMTPEQKTAFAGKQN